MIILKTTVFEDDIYNAGRLPERMKRKWDVVFLKFNGEILQPAKIPAKLRSKKLLTKLQNCRKPAKDKISIAC